VHVQTSLSVGALFLSSFDNALCPFYLTEVFLFQISYLMRVFFF